MVWSKLEEQSQVRIKGMVAIEEDKAIHEQFRNDNPMIANMLPEEAQHLFCLYKLQPDVVEMAKGLVPYTKVAW